MKYGTLAVSFAALMAATQVSAAGTWGGWYAGINAGYGSLDADTSRDVTVPGGYVAQDIADIEFAGAIDLDSDGFVGGIQVGYNWESGTLVLGLEGDFSFASLDDSASVIQAWTVPYPGTLTTDAAIEQKWLATLRARLGTTLGATLVYATAGVALSNVEFSQGFSETTFPVAFGSISNSETLTGWTAGVGAELPISEATTLKIEYLHVDLGSIDTAGSVGVGSTVTGKADVTNDIVRLGLNFKF